MKLSLINLLLPVMFVLSLVSCSSQELDATQFKGTLLPEPIPAPAVALTDNSGAAVQLSDYAGKIVLVYFGYTFCPDICPTTLAELAQVQRQLDDGGDKIQTVMISVDPERDTPQQLAQYVSHFHPTFVGLSGDTTEIDAAADAYGVFYEKHEGSAASGYLIDHTARVFVIDPEGNYQLSFGFGTPVEDMVHDLRLLMRSMQS